MSRNTLATWMQAFAGVAIIVAVVACGGGGSVGSGGTGAPLGVAVGTVNGFASVIVDGIEFDDRNAATVEEDQPGQDVIAEAKLGHRVEIEFDDAHAARTLRIEAAVNGTVEGIGAGQFVVLGQTVLVNSDATKGPITQFGGGYASPADVQAGDVVDVHGIVVAQGQGSVIQATRIEHEAGLPAFLKVTGIVNALGGGSFSLGTLTVTTVNAIIAPAGAALANGQVVKVMAPPASLSGSSLAASLVRIKKLPLDGNTPVQVSGAIASLDTTARTFFIGTQKIDYSAVSASLAGGQYVRVRGQLASDGTLVASEVHVRDSGEPEAELQGDITDFVSAANFNVRGVNVDASGVTPQNCPSGLANGVFVEVKGSLSSTTVIATSVSCQSEPVGGTVDREGTAGNVSPGAMTFDLTTPDGATVHVTWSGNTYFNGVSPDGTLNGKRVQVEGVLSGTTLAASKVKLQD